MSCKHTLLESGHNQTQGVDAEGNDACFYCNGTDGLIGFSFEFDCFVHSCCVRKALEEDPDGIEAQIIMREIEDGMHEAVILEEAGL